MIYSNIIDERIKQKAFESNKQQIHIKAADLDKDNGNGNNKNNAPKQSNEETEKKKSLNTKEPGKYSIHDSLIEDGFQEF